MFTDGNSLPIGGSLIAAALAYGAASFFVTGPLIGERLIERSNWGEQCQAALHEEIVAQAPASVFTPRLDCNAFLGIFGNQGRQICAQYGNPEFKLPMADQLQDHQRRLRRAKEQRLQAAIPDLDHAATAPLRRFSTTRKLALRFLPVPPARSRLQPLAPSTPAL